MILSWRMRGFPNRSKKENQQSNYAGYPQYHDKHNYFQKSIHFCHYYFTLRGKTNEIVCFLPVLLSLACLLTHLFIVSFCHLKREAAFCLGEVRSSQKALQTEPAASFPSQAAASHYTCILGRYPGPGKLVFAWRSPGFCPIRCPPSVVLEEDGWGCQLILPALSSRDKFPRT